MPGSSKQNQIARMYEAGYIEPRFPQPLHNPRSQSIGGPSQYTLTQSGREYLEILSSQTENQRATMPKNPHVFISHGKKTDYIADAKDTCEALGFTTELAMREPNVHQTIKEKVQSGINRADVVLVILTDDDNDGKPSSNAVGELHVAVFQDKPVIVFMEQTIQMPTNLAHLPYHFLKGQWSLNLTKELKSSSMLRDKKKQT